MPAKMQVLDAFIGIFSGMQKLHGVAMTQTSKFSVSHLLLSASTVALAASCAARAPLHSTGVAAKPSGGAVYVYESDDAGFRTKNFFYDNGEEVIGFDTQFTAAIAQQALAFLRSKTSHPLTTLVITHPNPDKFNAITTYQQAGARVVASQATAAALPGVQAYKQHFFVSVAKMFTDATYPALGKPNATFNGAPTLTLRNGEQIELRELAQPGVSSTQTVAYVPAANALFVGDLVHYQTHAWLEGGIVQGVATPTLPGWIADLNELVHAYGERNPLVYGGRGAAVALTTAVPSQIDYLQRAAAITNAYVSQLGPRRAELQGATAQAHYSAVADGIKAAFPTYGLPFMVDYSVYGLVNQTGAASR